MSNELMLQILLGTLGGIGGTMANDPSDKIREIRDMRFPPAFVELWMAGKWQQPDESLIQSLIPWLQGPIEFIEVMHWLVTENGSPLVDYLDSANKFREYRGSVSHDKTDLPWLDLEKSLFIAVNRIRGDDLGIALDFRTSTDDPRVVASYWCGERDDYHVEWRLVTEMFSEFLTKVNMVNSNEIAT